MKLTSFMSASAALAFVIGLTPPDPLALHARHSPPDLGPHSHFARLRRQASTEDPTASSPLGSDGKPFGTDGSGSGIPNGGTPGDSNAAGGGGGLAGPAEPAAAPAEPAPEPPAAGGGGGGGGKGGGNGGGGGEKKGGGGGGGGGGKGGGGKAKTTEAAPPPPPPPPPPAAATSGPPEINATSIQGGNIGAGYGGAVSPAAPASVASGGSDLASQCLAAGFLAPPGGLANNATAAAAPPPPPPGALGNASASAISAAVMNTTNGFVATAPNQVVVAPKMGDLRFVPFAVNVDAGSSVNFFWGAGPHTATQSSALQVCNKTQAKTAFVSGLRNATSTFSVPINDSSTLWVYCSVPTHCQKARPPFSFLGMFGLINPQLSNDKKDQMGGMIDKMAGKNDKVKVMVDQTVQITAGNDFASNWGSKFAVSSMPTDPDLQEAAVMNILMTRQYFAQNADATGNGSAAGSASQSAVPTAAVGGAGGPSSGGAAVATGAATGAADAAAASTAAPTAPAASGSLKKVEERQGLALAVLAVVVVALM